MIRVFCYRHTYGKVDGIPAAGDQLLRAKRGLDTAAARAAILLALVMHDHELALECVDFLRFLELACHLGERAPAARAHFVGVIEFVQTFDVCQLGLLAGAVAGLRLVLLRRCLRRPALFARVTEHVLVANRQPVLEVSQQLHLRDAAPLNRAQRLLELEHAPNEALVLPLQQLRCLSHLGLVEVVNAARHAFRM
jgi:hypothetical protein